MRNLKKLLSLLLLLVLGLALVACINNSNGLGNDDNNDNTNDNDDNGNGNGDEEPPVEVPFERDAFFETYDFVSLSNEYIVEDGEIELYFPENSHLPYVNIEDYLNLLNGVYVSEEFEFLYDVEILLINVLITYEEEDYEETMTIDSANQTINVTNMQFFDLYMETTETNYGEGLVNLESTVTEGTDITFELFKYDFEILILQGKYYLPLVITNLLFNSSNYFDILFNGDMVYGFDTSQIEDEELKEVLTSSVNRERVPADLKEANYNYFVFIIDYFYGLKEERNINSGFEFINKENFLSGDVERNIFNVVKDLDDLHTSHTTRGVYNNRNQSLSYTSTSNGPNVTAFYAGLSAAQGEAIRYFGIAGGYVDFPDHEYLDDGKTLVIYVNSFTVDTPVEVEKIIKRAEPTTENIIIDLAYNTGGNLGAVLRMFTLITNETIEYHLKDPLDGSTATYRVTGENPAYDQYNYFVKISSITFSAANLSANIAKELGIGVIGRKSSGGASSISFFVFPTGSIIIMSSNSVLSTKDYESIEYGVEVDVHLNSLYNELEIIAALETLNN